MQGDGAVTSAPSYPGSTKSSSVNKNFVMVLMDMKTLRTGQEQFVSTANHLTKVVQLMYSVFTRETSGRMSREFSLHRFRSPKSIAQGPELPSSLVWVTGVMVYSWEAIVIQIGACQTRLDDFR